MVLLVLAQSGSIRGRERLLLEGRTDGEGEDEVLEFEDQKTEALLLSNAEHLESFIDKKIQRLEETLTKELLEAIKQESTVFDLSVEQTAKTLLIMTTLKWPM